MQGLLFHTCAINQVRDKCAPSCTQNALANIFTPRKTSISYIKMRLLFLVLTFSCTPYLTFAAFGANQQFKRDSFVIFGQASHSAHVKCMCLCADKRFTRAESRVSSNMCVDARHEGFWQPSKRRNKRLGASTPSHPFQGQGLLYTTHTYTLLASCIELELAGELRRPRFDSWVRTQGHLLRPLPLVWLIVVFSDS